MEGLVGVLVLVFIVLIVAMAIFYLANNLPPEIGNIVKIGVAVLAIVILLFVLVRQAGVVGVG